MSMKSFMKLTSSWQKKRRKFSNSYIQAISAMIMTLKSRIKTDRRIDSETKISSQTCGKKLNKIGTLIMLISSPE